MKRKSFFKSLVGLAVAPTLIASLPLTAKPAVKGLEVGDHKIFKPLRKPPVKVIVKKVVSRDDYFGNGLIVDCSDYVGTNDMLMVTKEKFKYILYVTEVNRIHPDAQNGQIFIRARSVWKDKTVDLIEGESLTLVYTATTEQS